MALFRSGLTMALTVFSLLGSSLAVPLSDKLNSLSSGARDLLKRSTPATPHLVVYDAWVSPLPSASELKVSASLSLTPFQCRDTLFSDCSEVWVRHV